MSELTRAVAAVLPYDTGLQHWATGPSASGHPSWAR